jgi:cardiolipin synthase
MIHHIPNALSFLRIFLAPLVCFLIIKERTFWIYIIVFLAGITDFLDGYCARLLHCSSSFGALLDPVADKIFMLSIFSTFLYKGWIPFWFFSLVILRDVLILIGGCFFMSSNLTTDMSPSLISKWNTALLFVLCFFIKSTHSRILISLITITTLLSGGDYVRRAIKIYRTS